jgi:hypothetical protein
MRKKPEKTCTMMNNNRLARAAKAAGPAINFVPLDP